MAARSPFVNILIVDEIVPMEVHSEEFVRHVRAALEADIPILATIHARSTGVRRGDQGPRRHRRVRDRRRDTRRPPRDARRATVQAPVGPDVGTTSALIAGRQPRIRPRTARGEVRSIQSTSDESTDTPRSDGSARSSKQSASRHRRQEAPRSARPSGECSRGEQPPEPVHPRTPSVALAVRLNG